MQNPIKGLIHVTGEHDTGKSWFALSCGAQPEEIAYIDDDLKGRATIEEIGTDKFLMYRDFVRETEGKRELDVHQHGLRIIEEIRQKQPKVIIWDTWSRFAKTCHPFVVKNPAMFREFWSPMGEIKGGEMWQASFQYEAMLIQKLLGSAQIVFLTTHLKDQRIGKVKTGKQIPDAQRTLEEKANFRLWLRHNPDSQKPIGLVLKRIAKSKVTDWGIEPINVLPRKIKPCTWQKIMEYWEEPFGDKVPTADETPDEFELSILDGTLTADQKEVFRAGMLSPEPTDLGIVEVEDKKDKVMELIAKGMTKPQISAELGITVTKVIQLSKDNGNG